MPKSEKKKLPEKTRPPLSRKSQPPISQSLQEDNRKEDSKSAEDLFIKRLGALAGLLTALTTFVGGVILAWPRPNTFFPATAIPSLTSTLTNTSMLYTSATALSTNPPAFPNLTLPTQTVNYPTYAGVQEFIIIKDGKVLSAVKPEGTLNMLGGESSVIRVRIITNDTPEVLSFFWSTCSNGNILEGQGAFEIPYETPTVAGSDCVKVKIRKDDALLDVSFIFVNIQ